MHEAILEGGTSLSFQVLADVLVRQTYQVTVTARNAEEAACLARKAFDSVALHTSIFPSWKTTPGTTNTAVVVRDVQEGKEDSP